MVVVCVLTLLLSWGGGVHCCDVFVALALPPPPLLPVLLLCPSGLLQQWRLGLWTVASGVLQHTHPDHIACRECIVIAPVTSAGRSGDDQSSVRYCALPGYNGTRACVHLCASTQEYSYSGVCAECV